MQKKDYIKEFGSLIQSRIFTLHDVLAIKGATEKLLEDVDKKLLTQEALTIASTNKGEVNLTINELITTGKSVNISSTTTDRFKNIFDFVEQQFAT